MRNLVIDYGNSAAKVGIFDSGTRTSQHVFAAIELLKEFLQKTHADNVIISSVTTDAKAVAAWIVHADKKFILDHNLPLPVKNHYATPQTLGVDRLASVCGGAMLFPGEDCLVIDAGTCVTYDFIDRQKNYYGGSISPGLAMRFQALNTFTAKLPLVQPSDTVPLSANNTEQCIQSGVVNGMVAELDGIINQYQNQWPAMKIILCGGDTVFFENKLKASIFASPDLVLTGLNSILQHNVDIQ